MAKIFFTLEEAQGYINWLEEEFGTIQSLQNKINELDEKIQKVESGISLNGGGSISEQISNYSNERDDIFRLVEEKIDSIHQRGILVKNIEHALVDFPSILENREIYLCWHGGEDEILYWHEIDVGFSGRRPL